MLFRMIASTLEQSNSQLEHCSVSTQFLREMNSSRSNYAGVRPWMKLYASRGILVPKKLDADSTASRQSNDECVQRKRYTEYL
jgi:hypothetical protein